MVEVETNGKVVFEYKGTQSEVNTAGDRRRPGSSSPRRAIAHASSRSNRRGRSLVEVPLKAQIKDHHLQTRMARKLANGNYLVPQLLDKIVREYTPKGAIAWEAKTPDMPFTAIRLPSGNTLIGCTLGNLVIEVDSRGEVIWRVANDDLPGRPIKDACGVQRLPNGNTVITSYGAHGGGEVKLIEVTPEKAVVWVNRDDKTHGIHHFQILDTNSKAIEGRPLR